MTKEERAEATKAFWEHWNNCDDCGVPPDLAEPGDFGLCAKGTTLWDILQVAQKQARDIAFGLSR